jgi:hypothetical protein
MYLICAGGRPVSPIKAKLTVVSPKEERVGLFDCFYLRARVKKGSLGGARARVRACAGVRARARIIYTRRGGASKLGVFNAYFRDIYIIREIFLKKLRGARKLNSRLIKWGFDLISIKIIKRTFNISPSNF